MSNTHSDALVFFGATGDLAYKKIFPALQAMLKRGHLNVPVVGVAKAGWTLDQFKARAHDSLEKHGGVDPAAFQKLSSLLRYVDGDYNDSATFNALGNELKGSQRPAHYLAIPPTMFEPVLEQPASNTNIRDALIANSPSLEICTNQSSQLDLAIIVYGSSSSFQTATPIMGPVPVPYVWSMKPEG